MKRKEELSKGIQSYNEIMKWRYSGLPLSQKIRDVYFQFYRLHYHGAYSAWTDNYFKLLNQWVNDGKSHSFNDAIESMYAIEHSVEASFCSKIIHTLDPSMPIYDSNVCAYLRQERAGGKDIHIASYQNDGTRKTTAINNYGILCEWYKDPRYSNERKRLIRLFDDMFPNEAISDTKKIDFAIWGGLWEQG